ncbi:MAG: hypothetical protein M3Q07_14430 [Pseudobdellovibrionaceae bacterium]|nr:hypothetical protein [Pseudobdellovibrionaceae bacterium]
MSSYQESGIDHPIRDSIRHRDFGEIDLIDVIGFLWKSRFFILAGVLCGMLIGGGYWMNKKVSNSELPLLPQLWNVRLTMSGQNESQLALSTQYVNLLLKSREGAKIFYRTLVEKTGKNFPADEWAAKQSSGHGLVGVLENRGDSIFVEFQNTDGVWTEDEIKRGLPIAFNQVISEYNRAFMDDKDSLINDILDLQLKMNELKIKALRMFDSYAAISPQMQKTVVEGLMKDFTNSGNPNSLAFLLSAVPNDDAQKSSILSEYKKIYLTHQMLLSREKAIASRFGLESLAFVSEFPSDVDIKAEAKAVSTPVKLFRQSIFVMLGLGAILGAVIGLVVALNILFWRKNYARLKVVLKNP